MERIPRKKKKRRERRLREHHARYRRLYSRGELPVLLQFGVMWDGIEDPTNLKLEELHRAWNEFKEEFSKSLSRYKIGGRNE